MRPTFHPRTVNGPFDDPGLFVPFGFEKRAVIFDLGDLSPLEARDILKIDHAFISHTHMDHFIGFDQALRLFLGREKLFSVYGPEGFLKNVAGKLSGYRWNLAEGYENHFAVEAVEVRGDLLLRQTFDCRKGFVPTEDVRSESATGPLIELLQADDISARAAILNHGTASLGFALTERFHVNIIKERLGEMGLPVGPWLNRFKAAVFGNLSPDTPFSIPLSERETKTFPLKALQESIARITPGQKIVYVTDVRYDPDNREKIIALAADADHLFIEAAFLDADREMAAEKSHLTAWQAGLLAAQARVKAYTLFHHSPRYTGMEPEFGQEAARAFHSELSSTGEKRSSIP